MSTQAGQDEEQGEQQHDQQMPEAIENRVHQLRSFRHHRAGDEGPEQGVDPEPLRHPGGSERRAHHHRRHSGRQLPVTDEGAIQKRQGAPDGGQHQPCEDDGSDERDPDREARG